MNGDDRLTELVGKGSEAAFEAIVHRYRRALIRHCEQMVGDSDADEAVQDTLLKAHRALAAGTKVHSLGSWLHAIAHNSALALLAGRREGSEYSEEHGGVDGVSDQVHRERLDALMAALLSLPERQRRVVVMREFEGRSYDEIATALGTSNGAVRQLLNRARASIRQRLGALVPVAPILRWLALTASSGPSRALTLAGSGALAAKLSGAILMSAAPVVAVTPVPDMNAARPPASHRATPVAHVSAGRPVSIRVSRSAVGGGEAPAAVRAQVDHERERDEEPLVAGHVVSRAPGPERGVGKSCPGQQEEPQQGQNPAAERMAENAAEDPQQDQDQPGRDQGEQGEQTGHGPSLAAQAPAGVTQTG